MVEAKRFFSHGSLSHLRGQALALQKNNILDMAETIIMAFGFAFEVAARAATSNVWFGCAEIFSGGRTPTAGMPPPISEVVPPRWTDIRPALIPFFISSLKHHFPFPVELAVPVVGVSLLYRLYRVAG
jgi:hypothetical protein